MMSIIQNILYTLLPIILSLPILGITNGDIIFLAINLFLFIRRFYGNKNTVFELLLGVSVQIVVLYKIFRLEKLLCSLKLFLINIINYFINLLNPNFRSASIIALTSLTESLDTLDSFLTKLFVNF